MTLDEIGNLLRVLAAYQGRNIGEADVMVWGRQMNGIDYPDAVEAIHQHYGETRDWAMPSDIRARAQRIHNARNRRPEVVAPGCYEPDPEVRRRLGLDAESRLALTSGTDITRTIHVAPGPAQCRDVLTAIRHRLDAERQPAGDPDPGEEIRQRAIARARAERRGAPPEDA